MNKGCNIAEQSVMRYSPFFVKQMLEYETDAQGYIYFIVRRVKLFEPNLCLNTF